jgi:hypothetical protein
MFDGEALAEVVPLVDRFELVSLGGQSFDAHGADGETVSIEIEGADGTRRVVSSHNVLEPHVCGFVRELASRRFLDHVPLACVHGMSVQMASELNEASQEAERRSTRVSR